MTPECLYFSAASSQNKSTFKKERKKRQVNIICNVKQPPKVFCKKAALKIFGKTPEAESYFSKFAGLGLKSVSLTCDFIKIALRHECFPVDFLNILKTAFL